MTVDGFLALRWSGGEAPLIEPPALSPIVADPSFLFPSETPDGSWILYAHSAWGLHRYVSPDGLSWTDTGLRVRNAMRAFVRPAPGGGFMFLYEKYPPLALPMTALPGRRRWRSRIDMRTGADADRWGPTSTLLLPTEAWMRDAALGNAVSNPCLVPHDGDGWRLYFSASLTWIDDCGFCEPKYIGMAEASEPGGPYPVRGGPLLGPGVAGVDPFELGAGSLKAIRLDDGWVGLQNRIYRDGQGRSRSAIFALRSDDGIAWLPAADAPLVAPDSGWKSSHVYACDCRQDPGSGTWYLYFNARDGWAMAEGKERIGRLEGREP